MSSRYPKQNKPRRGRFLNTPDFKILPVTATMATATAAQPLFEPHGVDCLVAVLALEFANQVHSIRPTYKWGHILLQHTTGSAAPNRAAPKRAANELIKLTARRAKTVVKHELALAQLSGRTLLVPRLHPPLPGESPSAADVGRVVDLSSRWLSTLVQVQPQLPPSRASTETSLRVAPSPPASGLFLSNQSSDERPMMPARAAVVVSAQPREPGEAGDVDDHCTLTMNLDHHCKAAVLDPGAAGVAIDSTSAGSETKDDAVGDELSYECLGVLEGENEPEIAASAKEPHVGAWVDLSSTTDDAGDELRNAAGETAEPKPAESQEHDPELLKVAAHKAEAESEEHDPRLLKVTAHRAEVALHDVVVSESQTRPTKVRADEAPRENELVIAAFPAVGWRQPTSNNKRKRRKMAPPTFYYACRVRVLTHGRPALQRLVDGRLVPYDTCVAIRAGFRFPSCARVFDHEPRSCAVEEDPLLATFDFDVVGILGDTLLWDFPRDTDGNVVVHACNLGAGCKDYCAKLTRQLSRHGIRKPRIICIDNDSSNWGGRFSSSTSKPALEHVALRMDFARLRSFRQSRVRVLSSWISPNCSS